MNFYSSFAFSSQLLTILYRDDLFKINAGIVRDLAVGIATTAPKAFVLVITNPVNSMVPIVTEVFKQHNVFNPKR
jgi:malate dehydrogenase